VPVGVEVEDPPCETLLLSNASVGVTILSTERERGSNFGKLKKKKNVFLHCWNDRCHSDGLSTRFGGVFRCYVRGDGG
jgi:hypothetical protein